MGKPLAGALQKMCVHPPDAMHRRDRLQSIIAAPLRGDGPDAINADKTVFAEQLRCKPGEARWGDAAAGSQYAFLMAMQAFRGRCVLILVGEAESDERPDPGLAASLSDSAGPLCISRRVTKIMVEYLHRGDSGRQRGVSSRQRLVLGWKRGERKNLDQEPFQRARADAVGGQLDAARV